jgi:hypothetical protein
VQLTPPVCLPAFILINPAMILIPLRLNRRDFGEYPMSSPLREMDNNFDAKPSSWLILATLMITVSFSSTVASKEGFTGYDYSPMLDDKFSLWIGGFFPRVESTIQLDSSGGLPGDVLDFENLLGLEDSKTTLWGGFRWRISRRNQLEFEFNNLNRSGSVTGITDPIKVGDNLVQVGARIDTEFDLTLARLTYGFAFLRKEKHELAVKAGFHIAATSLKMNISGDIEDVNNPGSTICNPSPCMAEPIETDEFTVPLPHLGLSYTYAFTPKWGLRAQGIGFAIKIDDISGVMTEIDLDLHYQPWKHVGIGGGFRYWDLTIKDTGDSFLTGEFQYKYWGPAIYLLGSF